MKIAVTATPSLAKFAPIVMRGEVADAFRVAAELGYDGVELHLRQPGDVDRAAVKSLMRDYGLSVPTIGTGMAAGEDGLTFTDPDDEVRKRAVERVGKHVMLAREVGSAVTLGLINGRIGSDPETKAANRANALGCIAEVCADAGNRGVTVLLEPLNRYECDYINTVEDGIAIIEEIGAANLKLLADTFHENIEETDIAASLKRAASYLGHVHLVDSNRQTPGHGHLDMKSILLALKETNYQGFLSFEVLPIPDCRQALVDGMATVKSYSMNPDHPVRVSL
ncbi:MAG: TIM barrel protein [Armatimonadota bacterium]